MARESRDPSPGGLKAESSSRVGSRGSDLISSERFSRGVLPSRCYARAGTSYGAVSVSDCVCLSVTSRCSVEMDERINLVFGTEASVDGPTLFCKDNTSELRRSTTVVYCIDR